MNKERGFVIKLVGKDIYQLLIRYLLRALRSQFDLKCNMRRWPNICCCSVIIGKQFHPIFMYLVKHAMLTMRSFHMLFTVCKKKWKKFRVYNCLCGMQFAINGSVHFGSKAIAYNAKGKEKIVHRCSTIGERDPVLCEKSDILND